MLFYAVCLGLQGLPVGSSVGKGLRAASDFWRHRSTVTNCHATFRRRQQTPTTQPPTTPNGTSKANRRKQIYNQLMYVPECHRSCGVLFVFFVLYVVGLGKRDQHRRRNCRKLNQIN